MCALAWSCNSRLPDEMGRMMGRGIYMDTFDSHSDLFMPAATLHQDAPDPLIVTADHCMEAHAALKRGGFVDLHRFSESLLFGIGR